MKNRPPRGVSMRTTDRVSKNDRLWFEAHPDRQYLVRPWVVGESEPPEGPGEPYVIVRNVVPGIRIRAVMTVVPAALLPEEAPEAVLEQIWRSHTPPKIRAGADELRYRRRGEIPREQGYDEL
jgi:hypothetical protein